MSQEELVETFEERADLYAWVGTNATNAVIQYDVDFSQVSTFVLGGMFSVPVTLSGEWEGSTPTEEKVSFQVNIDSIGDEWIIQANDVTVKKEVYEKAIDVKTYIVQQAQVK